MQVQRFIFFLPSFVAFTLWTFAKPVHIGVVWALQWRP